MPELPEVETVLRSLGPKLLGRHVESVRVLERRLRCPVDVGLLNRRVAGHRVEGLSRRAKYLLVHMDGDHLLLLHLGMSGRLTLLPRGERLQKHDHVLFRLDDRTELRFRDPRRFGIVDVVPARALDEDRRFVHLGVEPLSAECTAEYFLDRTRGLKRPIKNYLMDAREVVGVGNIYASEALHVAGVHPQRAAGRVSGLRWRKVTDAVKRVLSEAIRQGGTTLNDFHDTNGEAGYFQVFLRVYGREGEACYACGARVRRKVLSGRSTYYCPRCQR